MEHIFKGFRVYDRHTDTYLEKWFEAGHLCSDGRLLFNDWDRNAYLVADPERYKIELILEHAEETKINKQSEQT